MVSDLLNIDANEGDVVGTLGFADELLALVACPLWGVISDRIGPRYVSKSQYSRCYLYIQQPFLMHAIRFAQLAMLSLPYRWFFLSRLETFTLSSYLGGFYSASAVPP